MRRTLILLIATLSVLILTACLLQGHSDDRKSSSAHLGECIPPLTSFAYPASALDSTKTQEQILPLPPWELETSLPVLTEQNTRSSAAISSLLRTFNGIDEIWIIRDLWSTVDMLSTKIMTELLVYQPKTQTWRKIPTKIIGSDAVVFGIHMGTDGVIWAEGAIEHPISSGKRFIGVYNQENDRFELVQDLGNVDNTALKFDPVGLFWIIKDHDGIYSFDPITREYKLHLAIPDLITRGISSGIALVPDGSLYIISTTDSSKPMTTLLHFFPSTRTLARIDVQIEPLEYIYNIFLDHSGRLWLNDIGWLEPNGIWYQVVRSPIFISKRVEGSRGYTWPLAHLDYASSDGRLWFSSNNGEAWLNPKKGEWCWFTTEAGSFVEDHDHLLWLITNGRLYKLP